MPQRVDGGSLLTAGGAILLIVSLFLHWFHPSKTAWDVFEVLDLALAAIAIASLLAVAPVSIRGSAEARWAVPPEWLPALGGTATVIVIAALINHPPAAAGRSPAAGAWIALLASLLLLAGGILRRARVSLVITLRSRRPPVSRPPVGSPPEEPPPPPVPEPRSSEDETKTQPLPGRGSRWSRRGE
jgi:hypothetical protein